ncbi:MAG: DUF6797 domain-containing protein, partial [Verrucomicrobiota bacterium]
MKRRSPCLIVSFLSLFLIPLATFAQTRADRVQSTVEANPKANWWQVMDTGPFITDTFRMYGAQGPVGVLKGVAIKVGPDEDHTLVFDTETMRMVAGFEGKVSMGGTPWDGKHGGNSAFPTDHSKYYFTTEWGPGWAIAGDWTDPREKDNDLPNGPLPDEHSEYLGIYRHEGGSVLSYQIAGTQILEQPGLIDGQLVRFFYLREATSKPLQILVSDPPAVPEKGPKTPPIFARLNNAPEGVKLETLESGRKVVTIPEGSPPSNFQLFYSRNELAPPLKIEMADPDLLTQGGPALFPETVDVNGRMS